jgi:hypothetical protein
MAAIPLPPFPSAVRLSFVHQQFNQEMVTGITMQAASIPDFDAIKDLAEAAKLIWANTMRPVRSFESFFSGVEARQQVPGSGIGYDAYLPEIQGGDITVDSDDPARACVVKLKTEKVGKSFRGRAFLPGVPNNVVINGLLDVGYRGACAVALSSVLTQLDSLAGVWTPVVVSYFTNNAMRPAPISTRIDQAVSVTRRPAHMSTRAIND